MKSNLPRKLILSIAAASMTAVCLTGTTFAWFARNTESWTEEFGFDIENTDGLYISIDGVNFKSSISNAELNKAIYAKMNGIDLTDSNTVFAEPDIELRDVTSTNLVDFYSLDTEEKTQLTKNDKTYYQLKESSNSNYIQFDLYFRVDASRAADKTYDLVFTSPEYVEEQKALNNTCYAPYIQSKETSVKLNTHFEVGNTSYNAGDTITINPANAMRLGVKNGNNVIIYEPNAGLGSYALDETSEDTKYNAKYNPMYQYLNAYAKYEFAPLFSEDNVYSSYKLSQDESFYKNTEKDFSGEVSLGRFSKKNDTEYEDIKLTLSIWLEGFDADYFAGVDISNLKCYLSFRKKEVAA